MFWCYDHEIVSARDGHLLRADCEGKTMDRIKILETSPGEFSLCMEVGGLPFDQEVTGLGHEPGGYFWEVIAQVIVANEAPELEGRLRLDPEGSMFSAYGTDRGALERLGALMTTAIEDWARLSGLVALAEEQGFDFED